MARTEYLVFELSRDDGVEWICQAREMANSPKQAIDKVVADFKLERTESTVLGSWAAVPTSNFHWFGVSEKTEMLIEPVEIKMLPDRQIVLPVDDPDDKTKKETRKK